MPHTVVTITLHCHGVTDATVSYFGTVVRHTNGGVGVCISAIETAGFLRCWPLLRRHCPAEASLRCNWHAIA
ncbi:MAG: hypothetical protein GVY16_00440 [Planctomycetes bacterium]|nr:hypothetical protein [Planctomycetota bacterium]